MKQIERFNHQLNNRDYFVDEVMKEYYEQVESLLKGAIYRLSKTDKIVVIGAGNLSDISLEFLLRFFGEIVLSDVDVSSINDALRYSRLSEEDRKKITVKRIEYTGFEEKNFFVDFKERLVNCHSKEKIKQVLDSKLSLIKGYRFLEEEENVNLIFVSPIYTQLVYHQILAECNVLTSSGYKQEFVDYIKEYMLDEMIDVIDRFNQNLVHVLSEQGVLFVLSDIFQLQNSSGFYRRVNNSIKNFSVMEELYEGYKEKYGMGLGDYGLYNLDDYAKSYLSRWLVWPFDKESSLIVKLKIYSK
jgi:hypothetical protein